MANYFSRLAASGARVGFDARSSSLPPANLPGLVKPRVERESGYDAGRVLEAGGNEDAIDVAEPSSTSARAFFKPSRDAYEGMESQRNPLPSGPTVASHPDSTAPLPPPAIRDIMSRRNPRTSTSSGIRSVAAATNLPIRVPADSQERSPSNEAPRAQAQSEELPQLHKS